MDGDIDGLKDALIKQVNKKNIPANLDLRGWKSSRNNAIFLKNCIRDEIGAILKDRNLSEENSALKMKFEQRLFFTYADGAPMATVAFLFFNEGDEKYIGNCRLDDLYFSRNGDEPFDITMPNLTIKEIRHLMEIRPDQSKLNEKIFTPKDAESLWQNYRYFPGFSEIEAF